MANPDPSTPLGLVTHPSDNVITAPHAITMPKLTGLLKPEYIYRPATFARRLRPNRIMHECEFIRHELPWGSFIQVRPQEEHGVILQTLGVIDLPVTEALWRLIDPGEAALDVGANIGYMTSVMVARCCKQVWCFEPNPGVFKELENNVSVWNRERDDVKIKVLPVAVSSESSKVNLGVPHQFAANRGLSSVIAPSGEHETPNGRIGFAYTITVDSVSLDELFQSAQQFALAKIDVEGHELNVLQGALRLLQEKRIRDVIFEEQNPYPSKVTALLESHGYQVFQIGRTFTGPRLLAPKPDLTRSSWEPTSFLATLEPTRATDRMGKRGWNVLRPPCPKR